MAETLRPLTTGELLDRMFTLYRRHFLLFVGLTAVPNLLTLLYRVALVLEPDAARGSLAFVSSLGLVFVYVVVSSFSTGAVTIAVSEIQLGRQVTIGSALEAMRPQLGGLILTILNMSVRIFIGFLLLIVPGVLLWLRYALTVPVTLIEERVGSDALSRSTSLTEGDRGRILLIGFLIFVVVVVVTAVWGIPVGIITAIATAASGSGEIPAWVQILAQFANFCGSTLLAPLAAITTALLYYDERVRKEGFDLTHMMDTMDSTTPVV